VLCGFEYIATWFHPWLKLGAFPLHGAIFRSDKT
jgi:hypothetical protein